MDTSVFQRSFQGEGDLPAGQPMSEQEVTEFLELPAALSEEEEIAGFSEEMVILAEAMGQPVQVDITRFPHRAVVYLEIHLGNLRRRGSAFFVTPNVLATAGHNLRASFANVTRVDVIVDMHGSSRPGTRYTAQLRQPHPAFIPNTRDRDVGIIRLAEDVGRATGFFSLGDSGFLNTTVHVGGYPEGSSFQAGSAGLIRMNSNTRLQYDAATFPGESGGVVMIPRPNPADIVAVGVHTHGLLPGEIFNSGIRMTNEIKSWILGFA
jgi:V8-like Glu-specific endopeptidase